MNRILLISAISISAIIASCSGAMSVDVADTVRQAEQAIAKGDMAAAQSAGDYLLGDENLSSLSASQLARLSIVYMQLADSVDQQSNINKATDLYDRAIKLNADSAADYYNNLSPDHLQYYAAMAEHSARRISPPSLDSIPDEAAAMHLQEDSLQQLP